MSNFKRILSLALTMLMVLGCFAAVASVSAFDDVTEYEDEIDALYDLGIVEGKDAEGTTYAPDEDVTRWQMALLIAKMMTGKVDNAYVNWYSTENFTPFTDVNADQFYGSMSYAHNMGVIRGTTDTTFNPTGKITYQDALTMLVRALGYGSDAMDAGYPWTFIDKAIYLGIDDGMPAELNYGDALTRGEVAKLLYNTLYADRYNDIHSHDSVMYTNFAYDVFNYYAADVTVMIVAAEGYTLDSTLASFFGATGLDYSEYNRLIDAKKGAYVGFAITYADPNSEYYEMIGDVMVLPASEFGLEKASKFDLGRSFGVVFSDYYFGNDVAGVKTFDKCTALAADVFTKGEFSMAAVSTTNAALNTVTIDGTTYYAVTELSKHLTNGDRNTAYNNDEILVINAKDGARLVNAAANTFENLMAYDLNGDGIYDVAYYLDYVQTKAATVPSNISYVQFASPTGLVTYYTDLYPDPAGLANLQIPMTSFSDIEGEASYPAQGSFYRYASIDRLNHVIIESVTTTTATGLVTGVDLYNKTVTLDSIDANNPGTVYNKIGVAGLNYCQLENLGCQGDFAFDTALLGKRVTLVMDETSAVIAINDATITPTPDAGVEYIFIRDTGRDITVGDAKYPIVALYDSKADIIYAVIEEGMADTIVTGDNVKLFAKESGYYKIEEFAPAYVTLTQNDMMTEFGFIDNNTNGGYLNFADAKVLVFTGTTFVEYDGNELGAGTWFDCATAKIVSTDKGDTMKNVSFAYIMAPTSYNVTAVSATSKAVSSIVYVGNGAGFSNKYAYINYDGIGTHNAATYEVTFYAALDMITGETRTVTFKGNMGEKLPAGFYYVDKNDELRQQYDAVNDTYTMVSANAEMTLGVNMNIGKYEANVNGLTRYGLNILYLTVDAANGTFTPCVAKDFGVYMLEIGFNQPATFIGASMTPAMYMGSNYSSDVLVAVINTGVNP